ncbi:reverse transcriptase, putative [Talaromyces stipitatus ATCC 10500]|uniref:Reverse transcriptase, putative n=1 Tax=Talaromyces stipitatus (strain ATCC 10500 / CBS 375.48 / QM 6759 / NRRL 1006) TaxID=441959 RepID=B8MV76_TALSN|nr:reverse transcriptase, putative [Talaromyces stipitatus ATCC 10500]EED11532.1 reverse transcriptase, putative [Talaromyces stipitatus ATCC 10500]
MKRRTNQLARDLHRQRIEEATESIDGFLRITRWVRNRGIPRTAFTPTLHYNDTNYTAPNEKAALFREVLHPEPLEIDLSDIGPQYRYPKPYEMPPITLDEVRTTVNNMKPNKAPRPDGIPNLALQRLPPTVESYLVNLFNACLCQQYCPDHFRRSTTVILRKPDKPDYSDPKAYRPIALLSTIGKALELVVERGERTHAFKFATAKYHLTHFWRKHQLVPKPKGRLDVPLTIKVVEINPWDSIEYLHVQLDAHLTGGAHVRQMRKKAAKLVAGLSSIAGSTWGTPLVYLRKMYTAVLQPQIMYACSTWYVCGGRGFVGAQRVAEQAVQSIPYQALYRISGAFKRTLRQASKLCLHVPPAEITLARVAEEACLQIMTSPLRPTLHSVRGQAHRNGPYTSPLHRLETAINCKLGRGTCQHIETIHPFIDSPEMRIDDTRKEAIRPSRHP